MKKTSVFLSVICLIVLTLAISASATTTHYEENFNDLTVSIDSSSSSTDKEAFETATGLNVEQIRNSVAVSTVTATDEYASWTGRGKVLKIDGTAASNGKLRLRLPFDGKFSKTDYNTKLYIEYDLYLDSTSAGSYNIFDGNNTHRWEYNSSASTLDRIMDKYENAESSASLSTGAAFGSLSSACSAGAWVHFRHEISNVQTDGSYYVTNATIKATNLSTNATSTLTGRISEGLYETNYLLLGGYQRNLSGVFYIDNVNIYTKDKFKFESSAIEGVTNVRKETSSFEFTMNDSVDETTLSTITLSSISGSVELDDPYLTNGGKTIHVDIIGDLEYAKEYTVNFENVKNSDGDEIFNAKKSFTFSTEAPELYISSYKIIKGSDSEAVKYSAFVADNGLYTFEATIKNTLSSDKELTVLLGLYDSEDNLKDTVSICKTIEAESEEVFSAGLTIPEALTGGNVKVFLWDNIDSLQAYDEQTEIDITASGDETALSSLVESTPDITLSELSLKKGFFGVANVANITEAKDNTIRVSTTVTGSTEGTVFFGVYKNDVLVSLAYARKTFDGEETVSVSMLVPAVSGSDTLVLKVFTCKDITDLSVVNLPSAE